MRSSPVLPAVLSLCAFSTQMTLAASEPPLPGADEPVTLERVLALVQAFSPGLYAADRAIQATEQEARQAGLPPNPELELDVEEIAGSGDRRGYEAAETTLAIAQTFETGGKRWKRREAVLSQARLAGWDLSERRLAVLAAARQAFVDLLLAQQRLELEEALLTVAEDVRKAAAERVKSGKVPPLEEYKADLEAADVRVARDRAARDLETAKKRLSLTWGGGGQIGEAVGELAIDPVLPAFEVVVARVERSPSLGRWNEERVLAECEKDLALAERLPDVTVRAGVTRYEEDGGHAGSLGLSFPVPLFNRNAGAINAARHRILQVERDGETARLDAMVELVEAWSLLEAARAEAAALRDDILPSAQKALESAQAGYQAGKTPHIELLDAQRAYKERRERQLEVHADYHRAATEVERLSGMKLNAME